MAHAGAFSRRDFIRFSGGLAGGAMLAQACAPPAPSAPGGAADVSKATGTAAPSSAGATGGITVKLPSYVPLPGLAAPRP